MVVCNMDACMVTQKKRSAAQSHICRLHAALQGSTPPVACERNGPLGWGCSPAQGASLLHWSCLLLRPGACMQHGIISPTCSNR